MAKAPVKKPTEAKKTTTTTAKKEAAPKATVHAKSAGATTAQASAKASAPASASDSPRAKKPTKIGKAKTTRCGGATCKIQSCKRAYRAKGYCGFHYKEWRHGKFGVARYKPCKDNGCFKPMGLSRHGYCEEHFQSYYVKGVEHAKAPAPAPAAKPAEKAAEAG